MPTISTKQDTRVTVASPVRVKELAMTSAASEKPWKVKSRAPPRRTPDVEIYETKLTAPAAMVTPRNMVEYHSVESGDGSRFCVPLEILRSFPALQYIWRPDGILHTILPALRQRSLNE